VDGVEIIPLAFHVDYWNRLGWTDRFSSSQYSARQKEYVDVTNVEVLYTPLLMVDGRSGFVGSDGAKALREIKTSANFSKLPIQIRQKGENEDGHLTLEIQVTSTSKTKFHGSFDLFLALTEDGLETKVLAGENKGRRLRHEAVVQSLLPLGSVSLSENGLSLHSASLKLDPDWKRENLHLVAWLQDPQTLRVLGATKLQLSG